MKKINLFNVVAILIVFASGLTFISCESDKSKIEKAFKQWVFENIDDPNALKDIISIEITDTISLYNEYDWIYTSFFNERKTYNEIKEKVSKFDWEDIDIDRYYFHSDSLNNLRYLKKAYLEYNENVQKILFNNEINEKTAEKAYKIYEANKNEKIMLCRIKFRIMDDGEFKIKSDFLYYYPKNKKIYEPDFYYIFRDLSNTDESKDLKFYKTVYDLRSRLLDICEKRDEVTDMLKKTN